MLKHNFKSSGGEWLGAVRTWIQWNCVNGDRVTWGSNENLIVPITVKRLEDAAGDAAWAMIEPFYDIKKGMREMLNIHLNEGKNVRDILKDMQEEINNISEHFNISIED